MWFAVWMPKLCRQGEIRLSACSSELSVAIDSNDALFPACCNTVSSSHWPFVSRILCRDRVTETSDSWVLTWDASSHTLSFCPVGPTVLACWARGWEGPSVLQRCRTETTCSLGVSQNKWKQQTSTDGQKATASLQCYKVWTVRVQVRWLGQGKHGPVLMYVGFTTYSLRVWDYLHQGCCTHS